MYMKNYKFSIYAKTRHTVNPKIGYAARQWAKHNTHICTNHIRMHVYHMYFHINAFMLNFVWEIKEAESYLAIHFS